MNEQQAARCAEEAERSPLSRPGVAYPRWYFHRWHFLPEGYLSRRSAAMYERVIRAVYYVANEGSALRAVSDAVGARAPSRVLDIGCGPGLGVESLAGALPRSEVMGVDLSPFHLERAVRRCRRFGDRVQLVHASALDLPERDGAFDAVTAAHFIAHVPPEAATEALAEAERVLAPGGALYILDHLWHRLPPTRLTLHWQRRIPSIAARLLCYRNA